MSDQFTVRADCPKSEYSQQFLQGMVNRMAVSFFKYGAVREAYPHKVDALASMEQRLKKYKETGNTEFLLDASNFLMIEFMHPGHPEAHFNATDSDASPGRTTVEGEKMKRDNRNA